MWRTLDPRYLNAFVNNNGVKVIFKFRTNEETIDQCRWKNLYRIGPNSADGLYSEIKLKIFNRIISIEEASYDEALLVKIKLIEGDPLEVIVEKKNDIYNKFKIYSSSILLENEALLSIVLEDEPYFSPLAIAEIIDERKNLYLRDRLTSSGELQDICPAMISGVTWNTIYRDKYPYICSPVSREWCVNWGGYVLFDWDTFFTALIISSENKDLAYSNIKAILSEITDNGFIPNSGASSGKSEDRSQPPVGSYCILKVYLQHRDLRLLEETYELLKRWHNWWLKNRDGNKNGLLEWGSNRVLEWKSGLGGFERLHYHDLQAAKWESGLDNSPMYDDVIFNEKTNTMELDDVGLNSLYALDSWALSEIAKELGRDEDEIEFSEEYLQMRKRINSMLWNKDLGIYTNRYWDGKFSDRLSPTCFYPLLAGIPTKEMAECMINRFLLNEEKFWGEYVIPSTPRDDPAFKDNNYWRGRIWAPMNFLVYEGLKRYGFDKIAYDFARKSINLFLKEWQEEGHIHENYNAITGDGDDVRNSDPLYTWGGLLAYIGFEEIIMVEPWNNGIRIGNSSLKDASIRNYQALGSTWEINISNGKSYIVRDGKVIVENIEGKTLI
jgi:glycogen debranching enzyme